MKKRAGREKEFLAVEMDVETGERTGRVEVYRARTAGEAAKKVLYTRRLKDGRCRLGPTGRVVDCGSRAWVTLPAKKRKKGRG